MLFYGHGVLFSDELLVDFVKLVGLLSGKFVLDKCAGLEGLVF